MARPRPHALGVAYALIASLTAVLGAAGWAYEQEAPPTSFHPALSSDGSTLAFLSATRTLVPGDRNGVADVFVKDLATGTLTRASTAADGAEADGASSHPLVSADGRRVAFLSRASNLVPGDTNGATDLFVKDLRTGTVTRASTTASGGELRDPGFDGTPADAAGGYLRDRACGLEEGDTPGSRFALSADGSVVAFLSRVPDLAPGRARDCPHVYVKNLRGGAVTWVSTPYASDAGVALSGDGWTVATTSAAVDALVVKNLRTHRTWRLDPDDVGITRPSLSADGTKVAFLSASKTLIRGEANAVPDAFVQDLTSGRVTRVSTTARGGPLRLGAEDVLLSPAGTSVVFGTRSQAVREDAHFNADVYVKDLRTGAVRRASVTAGGADFGLDSRTPAAPSADGTMVAFTTGSNVYVKNLTTGTLIRATPPPDDRPFLVKVWTQLL